MRPIPIWPLAEGQTLAIDPVDAVLRRRGHVVTGTGNEGQVLAPIDTSHMGTYGPSPALRAYLAAFGGSTFRKLARRLIGAHGLAVPLTELAKIAGDGTPAYVDILVALGVARRQAEDVLLTRRPDNIGPSLEWYVAQLCETELCGSAAWGVQLADVAVGGDYDVLSWLAPLLAYVELKSSRPSEISDGEIANFLERGEELAPDLAIFLVDTRDDLADLRARFFEVMAIAIGKAYGWAEESVKSTPPWIRPQEEYPGVSFGYRRFYVTNSHPSILKQLRRCLQHYYARVKGAAIVGVPGAVNFITGTYNSPI